MPLEPLVCADTVTRVSSVLNRDAKQFGKKHMFDASEETCWNSDQGTCQWVTLDFPRTVKVSELHIQFQGGFSSRLCTLEGCRAGEELVKISHLYPEDTHAMQISFAQRLRDSRWRRRCWTSCASPLRTALTSLGGSWCTTSGCWGRGSRAVVRDSVGEMGWQTLPAETCCPQLHPKELRGNPHPADHHDRGTVTPACWTSEPLVGHSPCNRPNKVSLLLPGCSVGK
ncbi:nuclear receptor 2C2-associated protein isoform 1-T1 [Porphyrio hochstetteri]